MPSDNNVLAGALRNVVRTIDGDTFEREGDEKGRRLRHVDTAETQKPWEDTPDLPAARTATAITDEFVRRPTVDDQDSGLRGKHGRPLVEPVDTATGQDLERELVQAGVALEPQYPSRDREKDFKYDRMRGAAKSAETMAATHQPGRGGTEAHSRAFNAAMIAERGKRANYDPRGEFKKGLATGIDETVATFGGLQAWFGDVTGDEEMVAAGMDRYAEYMEKAQQQGLNVQELDEIDDFDDFRDWAVGWMGRALPSVATSVAGGGIGGTIAQVGAKHVLKRQITSQLASRYGQRAVVQRGGAKAFDDFIVEPGIQAAIRNRAKAGALGAAKAGAFTGSTLGGGAPSMGSFHADMKERGITAPLTSLLVGGSVGALNALALGKAMQTLLGPKTSTATVDGVQNLLREYGVSMLRKGLEQNAVEGVTEGLQDLVYSAAAAYEDPDMDFFTAQTAKSTLNAMAVGALLGSVVGGAGGLTSSMRTTKLKVAGSTSQANTPAGQAALPAPTPEPGAPGAPAPLEMNGEVSTVDELLIAADEAGSAGDAEKAEDLRYIAGRLVAEKHREAAESHRGTNDELAAVHDNAAESVEKRLADGLYGVREQDNAAGAASAPVSTRLKPPTTRRLTTPERLSVDGALKFLADQHGLTDLADPVQAHQAANLAEQNTWLNDIVTEILGIDRNIAQVVPGAYSHRLPVITGESMLQLSELAALPVQDKVEGKAKPTAAKLKGQSSGEVAARRIVSRLRSLREQNPEPIQTKEQRAESTLKLPKKASERVYQKKSATALAVKPTKSVVPKVPEHKRPDSGERERAKQALEVLRKYDVSTVKNKRDRAGILLSKLDAEMDLNANEQAVVVEEFGEYFRGHIDHKDPAAVTKGMRTLLERHGREAVLENHRRGGDLVGLKKKYQAEIDEAKPRQRAERAPGVMEAERAREDAAIEAELQGIKDPAVRRLRAKSLRDQAESKRLFHQVTAEGGLMPNADGAVDSVTHDLSTDDGGLVASENDSAGILSEAQQSFEDRQTAAKEEILTAFDIAKDNGRKAGRDARVTILTERGKKVVLDFPSIAAIGSALMRFEQVSVSDMTGDQRMLMQLQEGFRALGDSTFFDPPFKSPDQAFFDSMVAAFEKDGTDAVVGRGGKTLSKLLKAQLRGDQDRYNRLMLEHYVELLGKGSLDKDDTQALAYYKKHFKAERVLAQQIIAELETTVPVPGQEQADPKARAARIMRRIFVLETAQKQLEAQASDHVVNGFMEDADSHYVDADMVEFMEDADRQNFIEAERMGRLADDNIDDPNFAAEEQRRAASSDVPTTNMDGTSTVKAGLSRPGRDRGARGARKLVGTTLDDGWKLAAKNAELSAEQSPVVRALNNLIGKPGAEVRVLIGNVRAGREALSHLPPAFVGKLAFGRTLGIRAIAHTTPGGQTYVWVSGEHGLSGKRSYYGKNGQLTAKGREQAAKVRSRAIEGALAEHLADRIADTLLADPRVTLTPDAAAERQSRIAAEHKAKPHLALDAREHATRQLVRGARDLRLVGKDSPVREVVAEIRKVWQAARANKAAVPAQFSDFLRGVSSEIAAREYGPVASQEVAAGPRPTVEVAAITKAEPKVEAVAEVVNAADVERVAEQSETYQEASDKEQASRREEGEAKPVPPTQRPPAPAPFTAEQEAYTLPGLIQKALGQAIRQAGNRMPTGAKDLFNAIWHPAEKVFRAVFNEIKTRPGATDSLKAIGDLFGPGGGFYETKNVLSAAVWHKYNATFEGWTDARKRQGMLDRLQGKDTADARVWAKFYDSLYNSLAEMTDNPLAMKKEMGYIENYVTRLWDPVALEANPEGAIDMLMTAVDNDNKPVFGSREDASAWIHGIMAADGSEMAAADSVASAGNATYNARLLARMFAANPEGIEKFLIMDPEQVVFRYAESYGRTGAEARHLGGNMEVVDQRTGDMKQVWRRNGKFITSVRDSVKNGMSQSDGDRITGTIYNALMGRAGAGMSRNLKVAIGRVQLYQSLRTLLFSTLSSFVDISGIGIRTGNMNDSLYAASRLFGRASRAELREMGEVLGVVGDTATQRILDQMYHEGMGQDGTTRKWSERFFKVIGQSVWTEQSRLMAVAAGRRFLTRMAHDPSHPIHKQAFKDLGGTEYSQAQIVAAIKSFGDGRFETNYLGLSGDQKIYADIMQRFINSAIMMPQAGQRPAWASHPALALVFHLKSFMYSFHHTVLVRAVRNAKLLANEKGVGAAAVYGMANMGLMMGLASFGLMLRNELQYRMWDEEPPEHRQFAIDWAYMVELLDRSGGAGIAQLVVDGAKASERGNFALLSPLGPAINQLESFISAQEETDGWFDGKIGQGKSNELVKAIPVLSQITPLRKQVIGALEGD